MAIYRNVSMSFWTDPKVDNEFTPDDKLFYLYLLTNPHTNLCGCYEISKKQIAREIGFSIETVEALITRFTENKTIIYDNETYELLIINWSRYNWTNSEKLRAAISLEIENVKNTYFADYLIELFNGNDTVSIPYNYGIDTTVTVSVSDTDTVSDIKKDNISNIQDKKPKKKTKSKPEFKVEFTDPELIEAWEGYVDFRKKSKSAFTDRAKALAVKELHKLADISPGVLDEPKAAAILDQSVQRGWLGLFEVKTDTGGGKRAAPKSGGDSILDRIARA